MPLRIYEERTIQEKSLEESQNREDMFGAYLQQGDQYLRERKLGEAEECFRQILDLDGQNPSAHSGLGLAAYYRGNFKEAEKEFRLAVQIDPTYAVAWNNLGGVLIARHKYSEAKEALEKALMLRPDLEDAMNQRFFLEEKIYNPRGDYRDKRYPSLSLCMIVKNEEKNLPRTLTLAKEVVDEIIVVDTGSTDRTVEVARSFGAQVYFFKWCDDFSAARNESLKYASGDWILVMDADEEMKVEDLKKIKILLRITDCMAFDLLIKSYLSPTERSAEIGYLTRVFRNHPAVRFRNRIHETVNASVQEIGGKISRLHYITVFHRGYEHIGKTFQKVNDRNFKILLSEYQENPDDLRVVSYLGATYLGQGKVAEAKELFLQVFHRAKRENLKQFLVFASLELAQINLSEGNTEEAVTLLQESMEEDPYFPDAYYWLGRVFYKTGHYEKSLENFQKSLEVDYRKSFSPIAFTFMNQVDLYFRMADCADRLGKENLVQEYFLKLRELTQNDANAFHDLGVTMLEVGCLKEAEECFRSALHINPFHPEAWVRLVSLLLQQGRIEETKRILEEWKETL
ncbi:MAG: tetratricopeptide repeat protein [Candidatus Caldatribacteriaceae bacterium]